MRKHETTGLMVCREDDESLVRMLLVEFISYLNAAIYSHYLMESSSSVLSVASPIHLASYLVHKEETVLVVTHEEFYLASENVLDGHLAFLHVNGVWQ